MKKIDDEINNYSLSNPDGEMKNIYENKVDFKNDKRSFVNENNVVGLNEQVKVKERINYSDKKQGALNGPKTNLALVSSFFATTAIAVVGTVIVAVFVLTNAIFSIDLYSCTSTSLTFYVNYNSQEGQSERDVTGTEDFKGQTHLIAKLYSDEESFESEITSVPFLIFDQLMPNTYYTLDIYDYLNDKIVFTKEYKTAPRDYFEISAETWFENGELNFELFFEEDINADFATIVVFDNNGKNIYSKDISLSEGAYTIELNNESTVYAGAIYYKNGYKIGRLEIYENYDYNEDNFDGSGNG